MMKHSYEEESPIDIAIAWFVLGLVFGVFMFIKLGGLNYNKVNDINWDYSPPEDHQRKSYSQ